MIADNYVDRDSLLHRFDPRLKLLLTLASVAFFFAGKNILIQGAFFVLIFLLAVITAGARNAVHPLKLILPVLLLTAVLTPAFHRTGAVMIILGDTALLTMDGLLLAVTLLLRFSGITTVFYIFFSSTRTMDFILALKSFGLPYKAALTTEISLRFIPYMFRIHSNITDAHKLRRAGTRSTEKVKGRPGFLHRLRNLFPVLTSVLIQAVKSIPALSMALDSKGFGMSPVRTSYRELPPIGSFPRQIGITFSVIIFLVLIVVLF